MMLVTGATGNFGSAAVAEALAAKVPFRALAHSAEKAEALRQRGVDAVVGDMSRPESLKAALAGVTELFLISPMSPALAEIEAQTLRAAREAGVQRVVKVSALSVGTPFQAGLGDLHAAAEAALRESGLEWTVLRSGATMGTPLQVGRINAGVLHAPGAEGAAAYCAPADVGALGVRILQQGGHAGKAYGVTGPEALNLTQVAAIVAAQTGRPLRYEPMSDADYAQQLEAAGVPKSAIDRAISFFQRVRSGAFIEVLRTTETVLGRPGTTYQEWALANAARLV